MNELFIIFMLVMSGVALLIFWAVRNNIEHVTAGYLKIFGEHNKELVKPSALSSIVFLYFLAMLVLPVLFYVLMPHG